MKALTVGQPDAGLIVHGAKAIENRSWSTKYRGPLAIHAGVAWAAEMLGLIGQYLPRGLVLGLVDLVDCTTGGDVETWGEHPDHVWCWHLANARLLDEPIPASGKLGLWDLPADVEHELLKKARPPK